MSGFYELYCKYQKFDFERCLTGVRPGQVCTAIEKNKISEWDFLSLLSPEAGKNLEQMAQKAHRLSVQNFGRVVYLYTPLYLSNYCINECIYCGFNSQSKLHRRTLSIDEVEKEGRLIAETGLRHLLVLTGESRAEVPVEYIAACIQRLGRFFSSISIEIYPLETDEYRTLVSAGVDGLTIYQEVYDLCIYDRVHIKGPKKNYLFRLNAPERACLAGMRTVNIGALLGLTDWRKEVFALGLHARYLQDKYPDPEISVSFPRIRPVLGQYRPEAEVSDQNLVQMIIALRLFLPRVGITISTRERAGFRDNLIKLGVTRMSAGSCTEVGGRLDGSGQDGQFDISDTRSVNEIKEAIQKQGYQPVFKDWLVI